MIARQTGVEVSCYILLLWQKEGELSRGGGAQNQIRRPAAINRVKWQNPEKLWQVVD